MTTKHKHGGRRPGAGRKPPEDAPTQPYSVSLGPKTVAALRKAGDGDIRIGIIRAVAELNKSP